MGTNHFDPGIYRGTRRFSSLTRTLGTRLLIQQKNEDISRSQTLKSIHLAILVRKSVCLPSVSFTEKQHLALAPL